MSERFFSDNKYRDRIGWAIFYVVLIAVVLNGVISMSKCTYDLVIK